MSTIQKIIPNLWFDKEAEEAAEFYVSVFQNAKVNTKTHYADAGQEIHGQVAGSVMTVEFEIKGFKFVGLNGGTPPAGGFTPNPSISFFVNCDSKEEVDNLWEKLSDGGKALMPLDKYDFSDRYGWVQDKYGVSWQLIYGNPEGDWRPKIVPSLLFTQDQNEKAEQAIEFYTTVFNDSQIGQLARAPEDSGPLKKGSLMFGDFVLENTWLAAMDGGDVHDFTFNEAISLIVSCETQDEIDHYWEKLSAVPESEQCGWLKDKFGVSWQIVPTMLNELSGEDPEANARLTEALLKMKKLDIKALEEAYRG